jgi:hypothetical protein
MMNNTNRRKSAEKLASHEGLPISDRIVVYGTRLDGVEGLVTELRKQLDKGGFEDVVAYYNREAGYIEGSFYDMHRNEEIRATKALAASSEMSQKPSVFRRLASLVTSTAVESAQEGSIPRGVIILPHMRQYTPSGAGMTITTPYEYIANLCAQHEVPFVRVDGLNGPEDVSEVLQQLNINTANQPPHTS